MAGNSPVEPTLKYYRIFASHALSGSIIILLRQPVSQKRQVERFEAFLLPIHYTVLQVAR